MAIIVGNSVGGTSPLKTLILEDPSGLEITGVVTENAQVLTAVASQDIREGKVAITSDGVVIGGKRIPAYETSKGNEIILPNSEFTISMLSDYDRYNYTQLQCIITLFNTDINSSVLSKKVVIDDTVYNVDDNIALSSVTKDDETKTIKLNITNDTDNTYVIRYFSYKEDI